MGSKSDDNVIWPDVANYLSAEPCQHTDTRKEFVVVSFEAKQGEITQVAFSTEDSESLLAGLIESLASQGNPVGMYLFEALRQATSDEDENENHEGEDDDTEDEEEDVFFISGDDEEGDDFGPDA